MKYACPQCLGHMVLDEPYDNQPIACPHCQASVILQSFEVATVAAPPVSTAVESIALPEIAGPAQSLEAVASVLNTLRSYCTTAESIFRVVVQSKLLSVSLKPDCVAATSRRLIILHRGLISVKMWDALWIDVADVRIEESLTGATLIIVTTSGAGASLDRLPKPAAREFYRFCQSREEEMRVARYAARVHLAQAAASKVNVNVEH